jgi:hypothetical protein
MNTTCMGRRKRTQRGDASRQPPLGAAGRRSPCHAMYRDTIHKIRRPEQPRARWWHETGGTMATASRTTARRGGRTRLRRHARMMGSGPARVTVGDDRTDTSVADRFGELGWQQHSRRRIRTGNRQPGALGYVVVSTQRRPVGGCGRVFRAAVEQWCCTPLRMCRCGACRCCHYRPAPDAIVTHHNQTVGSAGVVAARRCPARLARHGTFMATSCDCGRPSRSVCPAAAGVQSAEGDVPTVHRDACCAAPVQAHHAAI